MTHFYLKKEIMLQLLITFLFYSNAFAFAPELINYQGVLTDSDGNYIEGIQKLEFNIYNSQEDVVWGPQIFDKVLVIRGKFNVILGSTDILGRSISDSFTTNHSDPEPLSTNMSTSESLTSTESSEAFDLTHSERYLGIKLSNGKEIIRQRILSVPYALKANIAETVQGPDLYIDPENGKIGVGTQTPNSKLDVQGNISAFDPVNDNHVATKGYVDKSGQGCSWQGWKCHCNAQQHGDIEGTVIMGLYCNNGMISNLKVFHVNTTNGDSSCPGGNSWGACNIYSAF